jgi:hypothetical protein
MEAPAAPSAAGALSACGPSFTAAGHDRRVSRPSHQAPADAVAYHGEVWTDARGYATVRLPAAAGSLLPPLAYELRDLEPASTARVTAELRNGRFTIATEQPHIKVAWRISGRLPVGHRTHRQRREN